jgi:hypothetical protein
VLVSGTNLLSDATINTLPQARIMNLHTGLSPYIKGGPICTHVCLSLGRPDLIGNTVMWIDKGIDSGNILLSERTPLTGHESLGEMLIKNVEHGQALYLRAVSAYLTGRPLRAISQKEMGEGRVFLGHDWGPAKSGAAMLNYCRLRRGKLSTKRPDSAIRTVQLEFADTLTSGSVFPPEK